MNKFIEALVKYIGIPLFKKLLEWVADKFKEYKRKQEIKAEQKRKTKAIDEAKTPDDIRSSHRNNKL